jgi:flagellin
MSRINTNVPAIQALGRLRVNHLDLTLRLERLSTGLRINRGKDDPAGLIASETLRAEIHGIRQALDNSARAINVISTAEGALNEVSMLLLNLRDLVVSTANSGALTDEEISANQLEIDAILESINRISNNTSFGGSRLLDGGRAYTVSSVSTNDIAAYQVFAARLEDGAARNIVVQVTQSAETANVSFTGNLTGAQSFTSAVTIELGGNEGTTLLSFASGATLSDIRTAINDIKSVTGVSAIVSTPAAGNITSALILHSTNYGGDAFVSIKPISGNFVEFGNANTTFKDFGVDAGVLINGQQAAVDGLRADLRSSSLDLRLYLTSVFGQIQSSSTFQITGGGSVFQITPTVTTLGQVTIGIDSVSTANLGNAVTGYLDTISSGGSNEVAERNFSAAQKIITEAINQVAVQRGRLGSLQKNQIETNVNSLQVALENVTASESVIRDADIAAEVAALTRAQILVQSTQATLQIATNLPTAVLSLLGG